MDLRSGNSSRQRFRLGTFNSLSYVALGPTATNCAESRHPGIIRSGIPYLAFSPPLFSEVSQLRLNEEDVWRPPYPALLFAYKVPTIASDIVGRCLGFVPDCYHSRFKERFKAFDSELPQIFIETVPALLHARACLAQHIDCDDLVQGVSCLSGISLEALLDKVPIIPQHVLQQLRVPLAEWRCALPESISGRDPREGRFKLGYIGQDVTSTTTEPESSQQKALTLPHWAVISGARLMFSTVMGKIPPTEHEITLLLFDLSSSASLIKTLSQIHADDAVIGNGQRHLVDRARLGRFLLPAFQIAAEQGFITPTDDRPHRPVTVAELLSFYAGGRVEPSLFDLVLASCIANTGTQDISLVPTSVINRFLDSDVNQKELALLTHQYFQPTIVISASSSTKTVLFRDPREGTTSIAICEITTSNTINGNLTAKCEARLCCALSSPLDCNIPTAGFTEYQNRTQTLLEVLFPSHTVPWAWWQCSAQDSCPEGQPFDQPGRNADWAVRTSVLLDAQGTTNDPALQLLDLLFNLFTPARLNIQMLDRYRCRWDALLCANARLALSLTLPEISNLSISIEWYRWTVANARKADRDRLVRRFLHFGNHPVDVQIVLGQDCWTEQLFKILVPIALGDPAYDCQLFNTSYLGIIQFSGADPSIEQYYGSAMGSSGEAFRLNEHKSFLGKDPEEMKYLRGHPTSGALYFHEVGVTPGAQHFSHSLFRFPKTPQHRPASIHSRLLAYATEQFNIISTGKLNHCLIRRKIRTQESLLLMDYFKSQVNLPRYEPDQNIGVLNRVFPMCQGTVPCFLNIDLIDDDLAGSHFCSKINVLLETFYLETSKRRLTYDDIIQLIGKLGENYPDLHGGMIQRLRESYKHVLAVYRETYQWPFDDLTIPSMAGVLRYAFSEGFASAPCPANDNNLSLCSVDTTYFDWQRVAIEAQKLLHPNLRYLCTPKAVRDIWISGLKRAGGISRLALIFRNAKFLRDSFSGFIYI
ncbi:hypothetical protein HDV64DRAFT_262114 [Trichoderma sp. TUCIM 5745]